MEFSQILSAMMENYQPWDRGLMYISSTTKWHAFGNYWVTEIVQFLNGFVSMQYIYSLSYLENMEVA